MYRLFGRNVEKRVSTDEKKERKAVETYHFDATVLERAANAAKSLDRSPNAHAAYEQFKVQQLAQQQEFLKKQVQYQAHADSAKKEQRRIEKEEGSKTNAEAHRHVELRDQFHDELTRKGDDDRLLLQKRLQDACQRRQDESNARLEALRRATVEHEIDLQDMHRLKLMEFELHAKARSERENRDVSLERIRLKALEHRSTIMAGIRTAGAVFGSGAEALLTDWDKILTAAGGISLIALGIYSARSTTGVISRYIEARIGKPSLVGETSRFAALQCLRNPYDYFVKHITRGHTSAYDVLNGVILNPKLEQRLRDIAMATMNTRINRGLYRNVLLHGPPGTGKTLFAKQLAQHSGMDYAIMSGGDVAPMGKEGATAIHKVFDWSNASRHGLLLFVDEADAFLRKRSSKQISEDMRASLNAFLYCTSTQNPKFMLVLASNTPDQFDYAISDRLDEVVEFTLPGLDERTRLLLHYFEEYVLKQSFKSGQRFRVDRFDYAAVCRKMAKRCEGMSGREIAKLGVAWQAAAYASESGTLTETMVLNKCRAAVKLHKQKMSWLSKKEREDLATVKQYLKKF